MPTNFINPTNFDNLELAGETTLSVSNPPTSEPNPISEKLSGVVINQNQLATDNSHFAALDNGEWVYQEFLLPDDYPRGQDSKVPDLTGMQVFVTVDDGYEDCASLDWKLEHYIPGTGWRGAGKGSVFGAPYSSAGDTPEDGVWMSIYFDPIAVESSWRHRWRLAIKGRSNTGVVNEPVDDYDGAYVTIGSARIPVVPNIAPGPLVVGRNYPFDYFGIPAVLRREAGSDQVYYSIQQGVSKLWFSTPNPLFTGRTRAYYQDGVNPILHNGVSDVSIMFRMLAGIADDGVDFLGNSYRGIVTRKSASDVDASSSFWMSKPNPSRFAVENLYFDLRNGDDAVVVDHIVLDPITPGIWFNVYYSNDPIPGTDPRSWDNLLWERVPQNFNAHRRDRYTLPRPITAKYVKIEFTHLQAKYYASGQFEKATIYQKHPKWVLDYFLQTHRHQIDTDKYVRNRSTRRYDLLELAYTYFLDDIANYYAPFGPVKENDIGRNVFDQFVSAEPSLADQVDPETLTKIKTLFRPYLRKPFDTGKSGYALSDYAFLLNEEPYSTEAITRDRAETAEVSSLDREQVVIEKNFPVMSFPIQCRHKYRTVSAKFGQDIGYFAGIKEIAFTRDHYSARYDHPAYIESAGDNVNIERNDFETVDFNWVTYATS